MVALVGGIRSVASTWESVFASPQGGSRVAGEELGLLLGGTEEEADMSATWTFTRPPISKPFVPIASSTSSRRK